MCSANTEAKLQASDTPSHLEKPLTRTTLTIRQQFYFWMNSGSAAQLRQYASDMTQWHISGPKSHTSQNNFDMIKNMSQKQENGCSTRPPNTALVTWQKNELANISSQWLASWCPLGRRHLIIGVFAFGVMNCFLHRLIFFNQKIVKE